MKFEAAPETFESGSEHAQNSSRLLEDAYHNESNSTKPDNGIKFESGTKGDLKPEAQKIANAMADLLSADPGVSAKTEKAFGNLMQSLNDLYGPKGEDNVLREVNQQLAKQGIKITHGESLTGNIDDRSYAVHSDDGISMLNVRLGRPGK